MIIDKTVYMRREGNNLIAYFDKQATRIRGLWGPYNPNKTYDYKGHGDLDYNNPPEIIWLSPLEKTANALA